MLWLDDAQQATVDRTEPNYHRITLSSQFSVSLADGPVHGCAVYSSRWGCLHDGGLPRRLGPQRDLLAALLAGSAELRALFGHTPEDFVTAAADPARRERARELFAAAGWTSAQRPFG